MISKSLKSSGIRRLGLQPLQPAQDQHAFNVQAEQPPPQQHQQPASALPPAAAGAPSVRRSKALALSAFRSLVEGASHARPSTAADQDHAAAPAASTRRAPDAPTAAANPHDRQLPTATAAAAPALQHSSHAGLPPRPVNTAPAVPAAAAARTPPDQLIPKATKALAKLQQQLSSCRLTYLYQFDALLSTASSSLDALAGFLHSTATAHNSSSTSQSAAGLPQLLPQEQQLEGANASAQSAPVLDLLLQLSMQAWEAVILLLQHHHAAEPQHTKQHASHFHEHARKLWEAWETHSLSGRAAAAAGQHSSLGDAAAAAAGSCGAPEDAWPLTEGLCAALAVMAEAAAAWSSLGLTGPADWCHQQLRKHLCSVAAAGANEELQLQTRRALQRLQFSILTGNLSLAARQGHQAMWANLTSLVQQLLQETAVEAEEALSASLSMAGTLADTASTMLQPQSADSPNSSSGNGGGVDGSSKGSAGKSGQEGNLSTAIQMLEFAVQLLDHAKQQAGELAPLQQEQQQGQAEGSSAGLSQQVADIQQQVLMQLAQAYLASQQPARVLDCTSLMQGLITGRAPPAGLLQISSLALLQQGKLAAASAQLCAWLQQGAQGTEEACAAVRSFLVALHSQAGGSSKASHSGAGPAASAGAAGRAAIGAAAGAQAVRCSAEERAAAVQQVAAAAADRCRSDPAVALEVVLHLLDEQGSGSAQLSLERLAVQLLAIEEVSQLLHKHQDGCRKCHALLHDKGAAHYAAHNYAPAIDLLTPAVFFATSLTAGKSARLLAMALLKSQEPARAADYVGLAEQQEGSVSATGCIIRLQAALRLQAQACDRVGALPTAGNAGPAAEQVSVLAAVKALGTVSELPSEAFQAAFCLCMQHHNTAATWQLLLVWRDAPVPPAAAAATPAAAGPGRRLRLLQVLTLMKHIAGASSSSTCPAQQSADPQQLPAHEALCGMCDTFLQCMPTSKEAAAVVVGGPGSSDAGPAAAATAHSSSNADVGSARGGSSSSSEFTSAQLRWLVDCGLQLGVEAAQQGQTDRAVSVLQSVLAACSMLCNVGTPHLPSAQAAAAAPAAAGLEEAAGTAAEGREFKVALHSRTIAALTVAASILLQAKPEPGAAAASAHRQLQQAEAMLDAARQQLQECALQHHHHQQQQQQPQASSEAAAAAAVRTPEWWLAASVWPAMHPLQLLVIRLSFSSTQRQGQGQQGRQLLQQLAEHPLTTPSDLKAAALECLQPGRPSSQQATAALAYTHMLRLAAAAVPADLPQLADAVAGLIVLSASHRVKVKVVSKVVEVLEAAAAAAAGMSTGAAASAAACGSSISSTYPAKSLQWLIATCWNAAVDTSSSGDDSTARQYLQLVQKLSTQQQQQQDMSAGQQTQRHWLLGSKQFKQLWGRLRAQESQSQEEAGCQPQAVHPGQLRTEAQLAAGNTDAQQQQQQQQAEVLALPQGDRAAQALPASSSQEHDQALSPPAAATATADAAAACAAAAAAADPAVAAACGMDVSDVVAATPDDARGAEVEEAAAGDDGPGSQMDREGCLLSPKPQQASLQSEAAADSSAGSGGSGSAEQQDLTPPPSLAAAIATPSAAATLLPPPPAAAATTGCGTLGLTAEHPGLPAAAAAVAEQLAGAAAAGSPACSSQHGHCASQLGAHMLPAAAAAVVGEVTCSPDVGMPDDTTASDAAAAATAAPLDCSQQGEQPQQGPSPAAGGSNQAEPDSEAHPPDCSTSQQCCSAQALEAGGAAEQVAAGAGVCAGRMKIAAAEQDEARTAVCASTKEQSSTQHSSPALTPPAEVEAGPAVRADSQCNSQVAAAQQTQQSSQPEPGAAASQHTCQGAGSQRSQQAAASQPEPLVAAASQQEPGAAASQPGMVDMWATQLDFAAPAGAAAVDAHQQALACSSPAAWDQVTPTSVDVAGSQQQRDSGADAQQQPTQSSGGCGAPMLDLDLSDID